MKIPREKRKIIIWSENVEAIVILQLPDQKWKGNQVTMD